MYGVSSHVTEDEERAIAIYEVHEGGVIAELASDRMPWFEQILVLPKADPNICFFVFNKKKKEEETVPWDLLMPRFE